MSTYSQTDPLAYSPTRWILIIDCFNTVSNAVKYGSPRMVWLQHCGLVGHTVEWKREQGCKIPATQGSRVAGALSTRPLMVLLYCAVPADTSPSDLVLPLWHDHIDRLLARAGFCCIPLLFMCVCASLRQTQPGQKRDTSKRKTMIADTVKGLFLTFYFCFHELFDVWEQEVRAELLYILWADGG